MSALTGFFEAMGFNKPELAEAPAPNDSTASAAPAAPGDGSDGSGGAPDTTNTDPELTEAGGSGGKGPGGGGSAGGGKKMGSSLSVYNPGEFGWDVMRDSESLDTSSHTAGAIRQGTSYGDYEGWQDTSQTYTRKFNGVVVTFEMSARVRGRQKDDEKNTHFYVGEVRVKGKRTGLAEVDAKVEGARALWDGKLNDLDKQPGAAAVTFTLVFRIKAGQLDGGSRTIRVKVTVNGHNTWTQEQLSDTPG